MSAVPGADRTAAVELRGLVKRFGETLAVDGLDLTVPSGSFFGLVGPNGAGKTTTLSMATGLLLTWGALLVLILPESVLAIVGFVTGDALFGWLALGTGLVLGAVLLMLGVRIGGRRLDRRGPDLLAQLQKHK